MAITGDGTQASPYLITSYSDLKQFSSDTSLTGNYLQLANDINCKDYGNKFVWETISLRNNTEGGSTYFDLNGHTIKNVSIAPDNYMFIDGASHNTVAYIYNGNLENIYAYTALGVCDGWIDFRNMGISIDLTGVKDVPFGKHARFNIHDCGIRIVSSSVVSGYEGIFYRFSDPNTYLDGIIEDTDFIMNYSGRPFINGYGGSYPTGVVRNCRFTGKYTGWVHGLIQSDEVYNNVAEIDLSDCRYTGYNPAWYTDRFYAFEAKTLASANVLNIDSIPSNSGGYFEFPSVIQATTSQIRTGSWLRENNFEVVNV